MINLYKCISAIGLFSTLFITTPAAAETDISKLTPVSDTYLQTTTIKDSNGEDVGLALLNGRVRFVVRCNDFTVTYDYGNTIRRVILPYGHYSTIAESSDLKDAGYVFKHFCGNAVSGGGYVLPIVEDFSNVKFPFTSEFESFKPHNGIQLYKSNVAKAEELLNVVSSASNFTLTK